MPTTASSRPTPTSSPSSTTEDQWHDGFKRHHEADLILHSSDAHLFATRAFNLQPASSVFGDTLQVGSSDAGEKRDGRPLLRLSEVGSNVILLCKSIQRDRIHLDGKQFNPSFSDLLRLSVMVGKYEMATFSSSRDTRGRRLWRTSGRNIVAALPFPSNSSINYTFNNFHNLLSLPTDLPSSFLKVSVTDQARSYYIPLIFNANQPVLSPSS
ncbi:hypothetical protein BDY24DRAFT_441705 [Mrakia frigida]|uniref:uncharacterized protein n=1 Tax=Mrakia frigida TaxID=29902 RepID=UPI003FCC0DE7